MKKKLMALGLVAAMLAIVLVGGSLAYFTDSKEVTNTFTVGNVQIELNEDQWNKEGAMNVAPGDVYAKDPVVTNTGANDAWVRVNVTLSDAAAFQTACANHQITDLTTIFAGHDASKWTLAGISSDTQADTLTYSYYYNTVLAAEEDTGALFTSVTIPAAFTEGEMAALRGDFTITITADAIQTYTEFDGAADAFAAFDEQN